MDWTAYILDRILRWGLVALIAFTPLAFGTVEAWAIAIMEWGVVTLALVGIALRTITGGGARPHLKPGLWVVVPLGLLLALGALQLVPLPAAWLKIVAPGSAEAYAQADRPLLRDGASTADHYQAMVEELDLEPMPLRRPINVNPEAGRARLRLMAVFIALFLLVASWTNSRDRIHFLLKAVVTVGSGVALFGLVQHLTWNGRIYWLRRVPRSTAFGPFVNHNHFAGYVEMVLPVALSVAFFLLDTRRRREGLEGAGAQEAAEGDPARSTATDPHSFASRWGQASLVFFGVVVLLAALLLSQSRAGILSALVSGLVLFLLVWSRIASRWLRWSIAIALPMVTLLFSLWVGADLFRHHAAALQEAQREASFRSRWIVWNEVVEHLPLAGWAGFGLGSFEESFARFTPRGTASRWDKAHNDYLQIAWEIGWVGAALVAWAALAYACLYLWPALRSRDHPLDLFRLGIALSLMSIALHSCFDFNLQIGSNGFLFALLAGVLVALHHASAPEEFEGASWETATEQLHAPESDRIV